MALIHLASFLLLLQQAPLPPVSIPNFQTRVDYVDWLRRARRATDSLAENSAPLYRSIFSEPEVESADEIGRKLGFRGFISSDETRVGPWNPEDHPDWELAYQKTHEILEKFSAAAARKYYEPIIDLAAVPLPKEASNPFGEMGHGCLVRALARGKLENALRAGNGAGDTCAIMGATKTCLLAARQLERDPRLIPHLQAIAIRSLTYQQLRLCLKDAALGLDGRAEALAALRAVDDPLPLLERACVGESVWAYDMLQTAFSTVGPARQDQIRAAVPLLRAYFETAATAARYESWRDAIAVIAEASKVVQADPIASIVAPPLRRTLELRAHGQALRSGTRLLYEIFVFKDQHARWPSSLEELPAEAQPFFFDAVGGVPFVYRVTGQEMTLYSVGLNARDDGGKHDGRFGETDSPTPSDTDYVFWPAPPPNRQ